MCAPIVGGLFTGNVSPEGKNRPKEESQQKKVTLEDL